MRMMLKTNIIAFFMGVFVTGFFGLLLSLLPSYEPGSHVRELLEQWGVTIAEDQYLQIPIPGKDMLVRIRTVEGGRDITFGDLEIMWNKMGTIYKFNWNGPCGAPSVQCGGGVVGEGHDWVDYNVDGMFDEHLDYKSRAVSIRTAAGWVVAKTVTGDKADTARGEYVFRLESGIWEYADNSVSKVDIPFEGGAIWRGKQGFVGRWHGFGCTPDGAMLSLRKHAEHSDLRIARPGVPVPKRRHESRNRACRAAWGPIDSPTWNCGESFIVNGANAGMASTTPTSLSFPASAAALPEQPEGMPVVPRRPPCRGRHACASEACRSVKSAAVRPFENSSPRPSRQGCRMHRKQKHGTKRWTLGSMPPACGKVAR